MFSNSMRLAVLRGETVTLVESLSASMVDGYICINRASQLSVTLPFCFLVFLGGGGNWI